MNGEVDWRLLQLLHYQSLLSRLLIFMHQGLLSYKLSSLIRYLYIKVTMVHDHPKRLILNLFALLFLDLFFMNVYCIGLLSKYLDVYIEKYVISISVINHGLVWKVDLNASCLTFDPWISLLWMWLNGWNDNFHDNDTCSFWLLNMYDVHYTTPLCPIYGWMDNTCSIYSCLTMHLLSGFFFF